MIKIKQVDKNLYVTFNYDVEKVAKIKSLPKRKYNPKTKEWEVPVRNIDTLLAVFQDYAIVIDGDVNTKVKKVVDNRITFDEMDIEVQFKTTPYDHQVEGVEFGLQHNKFILGDHQGLGKTKQAIDIAIARKNQFKHTLIVCGVNSLKWNWLEEIKIHSDEKGHLLGGRLKNGYEYDSEGNRKLVVKLIDDNVKNRLHDLQNIDKIEDFFLVTNIETLRNKDIQKELEKLTSNGTIGMVIIDEIHKAKNAQSQQGKAIHKLKSYYKMALTGTPLINNPLDLYNILKWMDEEHRSFYAFRNRYCIMGGYGGYEVVAYKNLAELQSRLDKIMLRRLKDDVLDLPAKIPVTEYVEMGVKQKKIYKEVEQAILEEIDLIRVAPNPLAKLIRLRQATGHTGILSTSVKESAKLNRLEELVEEAVANDEKVIIFSNWTSMTTPARELLLQYNPAVITGDTKDDERMDEVNKFQNDDTCKVIIGTIGAMGTGLTLTAGSVVIFLDEPWSRAAKEQAEDRAHRIGTQKPVNIITLVTKDTIDERIEEIVKMKGDLSDLIVDKKFDVNNNANLVDYLLTR